jgi:hypothetical protein
MILPVECHTAQDVVASSRAVIARRRMMKAPPPVVMIAAPPPPKPVIALPEPDPDTLDQSLLPMPLPRYRPGYNIGHQIRKMVAVRYSFSVAELIGESRHGPYLEPRHVGMWLCIRHGGLSYPRTGTVFGGRDPTTVRHAVKRIEILRATNERIAAVTDELVAQLSEANT